MCSTRKNIIANNYVVRKMCYPIFCIPILKLMLFLRMLKHEYYFNGYSKIINKMIKERYSVKKLVSMVFRLQLAMKEKYLKKKCLKILLKLIFAVTVLKHQQIMIII